MNRVIAWYSDGGASACAAALAVYKYGDRCEVVKCDTTEDEHPDNYRFRADVERWIGRKVKLIRSDKYERLTDVFATGFMAGISGAKCTQELKKAVRWQYQRPDDLHELGISKEEVYRIIERAGIGQPAMYQLGHKNNNCLGCVKATSPAYWNRIRRQFPEVFEARAKQSREIGCRLTRVKGTRIFLDELDPGYMMEDYDEDIDCGPFCAAGPQ